MVTHFTEPAPNSVLLQVSKSSAIRDSQATVGETKLPPSDFYNKIKRLLDENVQMRVLMFILIMHH